MGDQVSASQTSARGVLSFTERILEEQVSAVEAAVLNFFLLTRVSFSSVESPSFLNLRKKLARTMLDELHESTRKDVLRALHD